MVSVGQIRQLIGEVLQLGPKVDQFDESTPLLGSIPEIDSMGVVSLITAIEEEFGLIVDDDEIDAEVFETMGSLTEFVRKKLTA